MKKSLQYIIVYFFLTVLLSVPLFAGGAFTAEDVLKVKYVTDLQVNPEGTLTAYIVSVPRKVCDKPGGKYSELYVVSNKTFEKRPFITGKVNVYYPKWSPDGETIAFKMKRGENAKYQVWKINLNGGEAVQVTHSKTGIKNFEWHPSGEKIAYTAYCPKSEREIALNKKGYGFIFYEENLKSINLYIQDLEGDNKVEKLTKDVTVYSFKFSNDGKKIAAGISEKNLIDHKYMFQKIYVLDINTKKLTKVSKNEGKLGNYCFSPDGKLLAYTAALNINDHAVSQVYVMKATGGEAKNLTPVNFKGHVNWVGWKNSGTIIYKSSEGIHTSISEIKSSGGKRKIILSSKNTDIVFSKPSFINNLKQLIVIGDSPVSPDELYLVKKGEMKQLTNHNEWLKEKLLGRQEVITYKARDGWDIEGLLIYPVNYKKGDTYPLIVVVHGGPESNYSNGWMTAYSRPGQVYANKGYAVFYPNYRASTGYGIDFAMAGFGDAAGKEFDDLADAIDHLVKIGIADKNRVGLGGGSYGGYAAAWFATYYTNYVKAVCMFVGISDLISKRGTTDIPFEEWYVHSGKKLEDMWEESLKKSPIYYAHQSKTATLIYGGAADTRVHPSQSLELYRRMKVNNHPAVRLVQYPGEGHGNKKQPGRIDVLYRQIAWYDWYVKNAKPLDGPMPALDISDKYGIELPE